MDVNLFATRAFRANLPSRRFRAAVAIVVPKIPFAVHRTRAFIASIESIPLRSPVIHRRTKITTGNWQFSIALGSEIPPLREILPARRFAAFFGTLNSIFRLDQAPAPEFMPVRKRRTPFALAARLEVGCPITPDFWTPWVASFARIVFATRPRIFRRPGWAFTKILVPRNATPAFIAPARTLSHFAIAAEPSVQPPFKFEIARRAFGTLSRRRRRRRLRSAVLSP
jgi:hypothetical protein